MKQLRLWPESHACPGAPDSRPVRNSLKRMQFPRYQFAIECGMPSEQPQGALTVTNNAHPLAHRSKHEIERGCAGGAGQRTQYSSGTGLGVPDPDITENDAQEQRDVDPAVGTGMGSHAEEKSHTRYRGIGSQHWQSAQEDWVVMGERARGENEKKEKACTSPSVQRAIGITALPSSTRMEAPTSSRTEKQQKTRRKLTSKFPLDF